MAASSQSVANPLAEALDFYFELALYLLVVIGFSTLAETGGLDWPSVFVMFAALAVRGFFLWKRQPIAISERITTPLTLLYFGFVAIDYFFLSRGFLPATVHLALFAVIVRMFSLRRERDRIMLAILAFLMVLASAVLTVDSLFLISFALFMLVAVATFILAEMRRSLQSATVMPPPNDPERGRFAFSLARVAPALVVMIVVCATVLFLLLPRRSAGYLGEYSFGTDFSSGFSDHVQLGQIGRIQQSNAVVMHVQIDGDRSGRYSLHWRGVALGDFDGRTWSKPRQQFPLQRLDDGFAIPKIGGATPGADGNVRAQLVHYRVLMEPIGTNVFFLAPWARAVNGNYQLLVADAGGAVYDSDMQHSISRYEAESDISTPSAAELRSAGADYPAEVRETYLRLPRLDPRVARLAEQVTATGSDNFDKASALENYLKAHYQYTLELPSSAPSDPIGNFLFERKRGHCEYFASSMAVMLRTLGIPSRVVNGFRSDEFNDLTGNYIVRGKDAHAWVEAYFPGYGWQTFDPTPAGSSGTPQGWSRVALYLDAMASFWREWIVSYDVSHQYVLGRTVLNGTQSLWQKANVWARGTYSSMLEWGGRMRVRAERSPALWLLLAAAISVAFLVLRNLGSILRFSREQFLRAHPEHSPEQAAAVWYRRMVRALAKRGVQKPASLTPQEFVRKIDDEKLREPVARFTEVYESARFGKSIEDAVRLPELCDEVLTATRKR
ncbi:MAG TPA: DUF3488 and transglutaminase-like domain-containing protein [Candidatus Sulfotelmatobacter sp.]|nr:DUF3488 and transglutaminase-like domain-containing protein [Candidatus Sulfotelmatobacter sp.]